MTKAKVAINGFGRIGRLIFRQTFNDKDLEVVAINDLTDTKTLAHLLKHDSSYGTYDRDVKFDEENLIVDGEKIRVFSEKEPKNLPWGEYQVDVVIESTGFFTDPKKAADHLEAGARKVVISAPAKGEGAKTIVIGVNEDTVTKEDKILSNASCTTNCIAPVMKVLEDNFGIEKALMTTVHSYTASQRILDAPAKDLREARAAFDGLSIRVPTPVVSLSDITAVLKRDTTIEELQEIFKKAAKEPFYEGILGVSEEPLVSIDYRGNSHSSIVDLPLINVVGGNLVKIVAWYDNEWGYSNRLVELASDFGKN